MWIGLLLLLQHTAENIECKSTFPQTSGGGVKNDHVPADRTEQPLHHPSTAPPPLTVPIHQQQTFIFPDRLMNVFTHSFYVRLHILRAKIQTLVKLVYLLFTSVNDFTVVNDDYIAITSMLISLLND